LGSRPLLLPYTEENGTVRTTFFRFSAENPAGKDLDFESNPDSQEPFLRYSMAFSLQNQPNELGGASLPPLEDIAEGITREMKTLAFVFGDSRKSLESMIRNSDTYDSWFSLRDPLEIAYDPEIGRAHV
jgi:hypothetical protein